MPVVQVTMLEGRTADQKRKLAERSATTTNAVLLMQKDKLGAIAAGAYADLLVVEGDPLTDLRIMLDPRNNLKLIMKDGVIYKNELS